MTKPDVATKMRNIFGALSMTLLVGSFIAARSASIVNAEMDAVDYWLLWVSGLSLIASIPSIVIAIIAHSEVLDALRSTDLVQ